MIKVLSDKGWKNVSKVSIGDTLLTFNNWTLSSDVVSFTEKVSGERFFEICGNQPHFKIVATDRTEISVIREDTLTVGETQIQSFPISEVSGEFLYSNLFVSRCVAPTSLKTLNISSQTLDDDKNHLEFIVKNKLFGSLVTNLTMSESKELLLIWKNTYGDYIVDDDAMALDMQTIFLRSGFLSYVEKNSLGNMVVKPYSFGITLNQVKPIKRTPIFYRFKTKENKQLHTICRSVDQSIFVL